MTVLMQWHHWYAKTNEETQCIWTAFAEAKLRRTGLMKQMLLCQSALNNCSGLISKLSHACTIYSGFDDTKSDYQNAILASETYTRLHHSTQNPVLDWWPCRCMHLINHHTTMHLGLPQKRRLLAVPDASVSAAQAGFCRGRSPPQVDGHLTQKARPVMIQPMQSWPDQRHQDAFWPALDS